MPLVVPAGSFFSVTLANASLVLNVAGTSATLAGTFAIQVQNGQTVIGATGVGTSFGYSGIGQVSLTGGQGAIIIGSDGVAGILTGNFTGDLTSLGAERERAGHADVQHVGDDGREPDGDRRGPPDRRQRREATRGTSG